MTSNIKEFNTPLTMVHPNFAIYSAKRNSGKSHLMKWMIYNVARSYNEIIIICPTSFNGDYTQITNNIYGTFDEGLIKHIIKKQTDLRKKGKAHRLLLVLDDCLSKANFNSRVFEQIATQGRHYHISCWISTQHYMKLPPVIRLNCDYMLLLGNQTARVMKTIYEELGGSCFDNENEFSATIKHNLLNYGCFIINNLKGKCHTMRAPADIPKFRLTTQIKKRV